MELVGLKRCLAELKEANISVHSLTTDRHVQVEGYMAREQPKIMHSLIHGTLQKVGIFLCIPISVNRVRSCDKCNYIVVGVEMEYSGSGTILYAALM